MNLSATLLHNAVGWADADTPIARSVPVPGLKSVHNRRDWASWGKVEIAPGVYDWTISDHWVRENIRQGLTPICNLSGWPSFRQTSKTSDLPSAQDFAVYCEIAAKQLSSLGVAIVEVFNEFDSHGWPGYGHAAAMGRLWRVAHDIFAAAGFKVILGNFQSLGPTGEGLRAMAAALQAFDARPHAVAVHLYDMAYPMAAFGALLQQARGVMVAHGAADAELWVTEFGNVNFANLTAKAQGAWLRAVMRQCRDNDVTAALFWQFDDANRTQGGFGFDDQKAGKTIWNAAVRAVQ